MSEQDSTTGIPDKAASGVFAAGRALVIGVAHYRAVSVLPAAVLNDARDVADVLKAQQHCAFPPEKVTVLLDADAASIRKELGALVNDAREDEFVIIFFSGHGGRVGGSPTSVLLAADYHSSDIAGTAVSEAELTSCLKSIRASRLLVVLDACHSGGAGNLKAPDLEVLGFAEKSLSAFAEGKGRVVIASSRTDEKSYVLPGMRNSLFTSYLIEALKGNCPTRGDGLIRIFDVFNHVSEKVHNKQKNQHPIFKANDMENNFVVALDAGGIKKTPACLEGDTTIHDGMWKILETTLPELYPLGPLDLEVWSRAGGDIARLKLGSSGHASWHAALRTLRQGGGGVNISATSLVQAVLQDFPHHHVLGSLRP